MIRACGVEAEFLGTLAAEPIKSAAAPSLMLEALPAVIVPSGPNAGLSVRSFGSSNLLGPSSVANTVVLPRTVISTGTISTARPPLRWPCGRVWLRTAKSSCLSCEAELRGAGVGEDAHVLVVESVGQTVIDQGVVQLAVAHAIALAGLEQ